MIRHLTAALALVCAFAAPARAVTAKVSAVNGELAYRLGDGEWTDAAVGQELKSEMELCTGPGSDATIAFSDGSALKLKEMSQLRVGELLSQENRIKVEMHLRSGELAAQVKPQKAVATDFSVQTPNATASVKGTQIKRIAYSPQTGTLTELATGRLLVQSERGETSTGAGDKTEVDADDTLSTPQDITQQNAQVQVQPTGLVSEENTIITNTLAPQATTMTISGDSSTTDIPVPDDDTASLLLRFEIE